jgi:hypothetical protein
LVEPFDIVFKHTMMDGDNVVYSITTILPILSKFTNDKIDQYIIQQRHKKLINLNK